MTQVRLEIDPDEIDTDMTCLLFSGPASAPDPAAQSTFSGQFFFFSIWFGFQTFFRFESPIPDGAIINGVQFEFVASTGSTFGVATIAAGFISPDSIWETSNKFGLTGYPSVDDVPLAERFQGAAVDLTIWQDDAPGFHGLVALQDFSGAPSTWGDGLSSDVDMPGLKAQLQNYLDSPATQALRGATEPGQIPVAFSILLPWAAQPSQEKRQGVFQTLGVAQRMSALVIDFSIPTTNPLSRGGRLAPGRSARGVLDPAQSASAQLMSANSARGNLGKSVTGRARLGRSSTGRGGTL